MYTSKLTGGGGDVRSQDTYNARMLLLAMQNMLLLSLVVTNNSLFGVIF